MSDQPIAWGIPRPDGTIIDCITPEEHAREPGQYTVPLYAAPQPKAEQEPVGTYEEVMQTMRSLQTGTLVAQQQMFELLKDKPLYAAPQPRHRLTDEEIAAVVAPLGFAQLSPTEVARAIENAIWGIKE
jgi:hypothetical protein